MATFLIDYENVWMKNGLQGVEYLTEDDILCLFYSRCCDKIQAETMNIIKDSKCEIQSFELVKTGKNALDFYIASECGIISNQGETQIVIISNDKGFQAVVDFFKSQKENLNTEVVVASNIENGIIALHGLEDNNRREEIRKRVKKLSLSNELTKYKVEKEYQEKVIAIFKGTKYEFIIDKILDVINDNKLASKKELYTSSLHNFGRHDGIEIYRLMKEVVWKGKDSIIYNRLDNKK